MKNGKKIVFIAKEGVTFRVTEGVGEIVIEATNEPVCSDVSYSYYNPRIPEGYVHYKGTWDTGFVIRNANEDPDEATVFLTWVPIRDVKELVRIDWGRGDFSKFHEDANPEFLESVKKYGGFYISTYHASKENGDLAFKKGNEPWTYITYESAENQATRFATLRGIKDVVTCMPSGAAFDAILKWVIDSGAKPRSVVVGDSTSWGHFFNSVKDPYCSERTAMPTGSKKEWSAVNIYDLVGNVAIWTSENSLSYRECKAIRGGSYKQHGNVCNASERCPYDADKKHLAVGFRMVMYFKP